MKLKRLKNEIMLSFVVVTIIIIIFIELVSFWWIRHDMQERIIDSTFISLTQLDLNIISLMGGINDISKFTIANKDVRMWLKSEYGTDAPHIAEVELLSRINEAYSNLTNSKTFIAAINIYGMNGQAFETAGKSTPKNQTIEAENFKKIPDDGNLYFTDTYIRKYYTLGSQHVISVYQYLRDINNFSKKIGLLRLDISENVINNLYKDIIVGETGYIFISNKEGKIISHSDKKFIGLDISITGFNINEMVSDKGYFLKKEKGEKILLTYYKSDTLNMIFLSKTPYAELMNKINITRNLTIFITLISIIIISSIFYILSSHISSPINHLLEGMKKVESGNFDTKIIIDRDDEIGELSKGFNHMVERLKRLINENYIIQIKKKEAELAALQSQINPHFLYNTLDIAYWSSRMEDSPNTERILSNLSKVFKLGLNKGNEFTTIGKEIEHLQSYINIQMIRFEEEPNIKILIDKKFYDIKILKLLLQPVVENALLHGIDGMEDKGEVIISCFVKNKCLIFEVHDNGKGMSEETIKSILNEERTVSGYGIKNVHERIQLYYGEEYGLTINSELGKGTIVKIKIPLTNERRLYD